MNRIACDAPLQAGMTVTTTTLPSPARGGGEGGVVQKQPLWLLDRPVNPRIKSGEGGDTHLEAVIFVMS